MALRIPMAAWMTTLHMFFFCSFILFYFKGLILYALQRYNIAKAERALGNLAWKNVKIGGIRGNYCAANAW